MKLKRNYKILLSFILIILSWLMIGIGYTLKIGHPINTILFVSGIIFILVGIVLLILSVNSKD